MKSAWIGLVLSCEHAENRVPAEWRSVFRGKKRLLASHRGHDPGALEIARIFARRLRAPLVACRVTRLLADTNRSPGSPEAVSKFVRKSGADVARVLKRYHAPHRAKVAAAAGRAAAGGRLALHVALHTFTPVLRGVRRDVDVGILFDPARRLEREIASAWRSEIRSARETLRVRFNSPYEGVADGLPTTLRGVIPKDRYAGIELEVSQRFARRGSDSLRDLARDLALSLARVLEKLPLPDGRAPS